MKLKTNRIDDSAGEIFFYAEVDGSGFFGASEADVLDAVEELGDVNTINFYINSFGGDAFAGIAIYHALRRLSAEIHVRVDGVAASAASVIAMAGDRITMNRGSMMMIHNAGLFAIGNKSVMEEARTILEKIDASALDIYAARPGADRAALKAAMDGDGKADGTWMTAAEAVEMKLADDAEDSGKKSSAKARASMALSDPRANRAGTIFSAAVARAAGRQQDAQNFIHQLTAGSAIQAVENAIKDEPRNEPTETPAPIEQLKEPEADMSKAIAALQEKRRILNEQLNKMVDQAASRDDKAFTSAELSEMKTLKTAIAELDANIEAYRDAAEITARGDAPMTRQTAADSPTVGAERPSAPTIISKRDARSKTETGGYENFGELAMDIYKASKTGQRSSRLAKMAANGYEGEKGGFFLPEAFQEQVIDATIKSDPLLSRCTSPEIETRSIVMPVDEDEPHETTGLKAGNAGEGKSVSESEIKIGKARVEVVKHEVKTKVTDELLADSRALTAYLSMKAQEKLGFQISDQIFRGNGVGQMSGFLNSGALVTVAAEAGQAADTIVAENIVNMAAALPASSADSAVWLLSHALASQVPLLAIKATSEVVYVAPGTFKDKPGETLQGMPVIKHLACSDKGDVGDICLVDLKQYFAPRLMGGVELRVYDQIGWDDDTIGFKWIFRVGGRPFRNKPSTVKYGNFKISPFVALAAR